jgi:ribosome biogenesis GTPase / thiamine phosphate phosphatase
MNIEKIDPKWGFDAFIQFFYEEEIKKYPQAHLARVVSSNREIYGLMELGEGQIHHAKVRGQLRSKSEFTRSCEIRGRELLISNVDKMFIVSSCNRDFNLARLERILHMVQSQGIVAKILLNKSDLLSAGDAEKLLEEVRTRTGISDVFLISALSGQGVCEFTSQIKEGESIAMLGMSGVGKSTLSNLFKAGEKIKVSAIREEDARGRHTTTERQMFLAEQGFWIIDTPGMRLFSAGVSEEEGLASGAFADIQELIAKCRFSDCQHKSEGSCAVKNSLADGTLESKRWENYLKLKSEERFFARKQSKVLHSQEKKKWAKISKDFEKRKRVERFEF